MIAARTSRDRGSAMREEYQRVDKGEGAIASSSVSGTSRLTSLTVSVSVSVTVSVGVGVGAPVIVAALVNGNDAVDVIHAVDIKDRQPHPHRQHALEQLDPTHVELSVDRLADSHDPDV